MDPVVVPIEDAIDLHHFNPKDIPDLVDEYIRACREKNILTVRIIHGKGKGVQRERVHSVLKKNPHVIRFSLGGMHSGEWGATVVELMPLAMDSP
jgi:dsDNA-specific endonuclease/ATPase MutS2